MKNGIDEEKRRIAGVPDEWRWALKELKRQAVTTSRVHALERRGEAVGIPLAQILVEDRAAVVAGGQAGVGRSQEEEGFLALLKRPWRSGIHFDAKPLATIP